MAFTDQDLPGARFLRASDAVTPRLLHGATTCATTCGRACGRACGTTCASLGADHTSQARRMRRTSRSTPRTGGRASPGRPRSSTPWPPGAGASSSRVPEDDAGDLLSVGVLQEVRLVRKLVPRRARDELVPASSPCRREHLVGASPDEMDAKRGRVDGCDTQGAGDRVPRRLCHLVAAAEADVLDCAAWP